MWRPERVTLPCWRVLPAPREAQEDVKGKKRKQVLLGAVGTVVGAAQDGLASAPLPLHGPRSHMPCQQQQRGRVSALSHFSAGSGKESWGHQ